jgi:hypothetical protein
MPNEIDGPAICTKDACGAFPVEGEGYDWNLSRYIHLNPCFGSKPLADSLEQYRYSSYAGYARESRRVDRVDYDQHHRDWHARNGGDPESAYRRFVKEGLTGQSDNAIDRLKDWGNGSEEFLRKLVQMADREELSSDTSRIVRKSQLSVDQVLQATAAEYGVEKEDCRGFRSAAAGRDIAAYLCRRYTTATLAELSEAFGLSHRDSSGDLAKRAKARIKTSSQTQQRLLQIERRLHINPESRV